MEGTEKSESSYYSLMYWDRIPSYLPCCGYEKSNWTTYFNKNVPHTKIFQVKSNLVHDFTNFNALKIILKIHLKTRKLKTERSRPDRPDSPDTHTRESSCGLVHICKIGDKTLQ